MAVPRSRCRMRGRRSTRGRKSLLWPGESAQNLEDTLNRYVRPNNHHIPQRGLGHIAPLQALQDWQERCPRLFKKKVFNLTVLHTGADPLGRRPRPSLWLRPLAPKAGSAAASPRVFGRTGRDLTLTATPPRGSACVPSAGLIHAFPHPHPHPHTGK